jgi:hypothetical protein
VSKTIEALEAACVRDRCILDAEKARGAGSGLHPCQHCVALCKLRYPFCFSCMQLLPIRLRNQVTGNNPNARSTLYQVRHWQGINAARLYLKASDRAAHIRQQSEMGEDWAMQTLWDAGELDHAGYTRILEARQARREGKVSV